ncbi:uncharacterized protein LOC141735187 [Larus michahellis]|uniref:uncharacterized protein LOC141735187 n=1 Tax=Larus michahellis TaxID=119627 RepID=UPI003D9BCF87
MSPMGTHHKPDPKTPPRAGFWDLPPRPPMHRGCTHHPAEPQNFTELLAMLLGTTTMTLRDGDGCSRLSRVPVSPVEVWERAMDPWGAAEAEQTVLFGGDEEEDAAYDPPVMQGTPSDPETDPPPTGDPEIIQLDPATLLAQPRRRFDGSTQPGAGDLTLDRGATNRTPPAPREVGAGGKTGSGANAFSNFKSIIVLQKSYECGECGKSFSCSSHFSKHRRTHTGRNPSSASLVGRASTSAPNLYRHQRAHAAEKTGPPTPPARPRVCRINARNAGRVFVGTRSW